MKTILKFGASLVLGAWCLVLPALRAATMPLGSADVTNRITAGKYAIVTDGTKTWRIPVSLQFSNRTLSGETDFGTSADAARLMIYATGRVDGGMLHFTIPNGPQIINCIIEARSQSNGFSIIMSGPGTADGGNDRYIPTVFETFTMGTNPIGSSLRFQIFDVGGGSLSHFRQTIGNDGTTTFHKWGGVDDPGPQLRLYPDGSSKFFGDLTLSNDLNGWRHTLVDGSYIIADQKDPSWGAPLIFTPGTQARYNAITVMPTGPVWFYRGFTNEAHSVFKGLVTAHAGVTVESGADSSIGLSIKNQAVGSHFRLFSTAADGSLYLSQINSSAVPFVVETNAPNLGFKLSRSGAHFGTAFVASNTTTTLNISGLAAPSGSGLTIASNGNIGIGMVPTVALDVTGAIKSSGAISSGANTYQMSGTTRLLGSGNDLYFEALNSSSGYHFRNSGFSDLVTISSAGNVGVGTASPTNTLHVQGHATIATNLFLPNAPTSSVPVNMLGQLADGRVVKVAAVAKVYRALVRQTTGDPAVIVLENQLGGTVNWAQTSSGQFNVGNSAFSLFTTNKTFVRTEAYWDSTSGPGEFRKLETVSTSTVTNIVLHNQVVTTGVIEEGIIPGLPGGVPFEILVYP